MHVLKKLCFLGFISALSFAFSGCESDAQVASRNLSIEAGMFKVERRVVFYNGITGEYILTVEGRCQVEHASKLEITCKIGDQKFKKHYLGLSDNVTYFVEQLEDSNVSEYRYKVIFKPELIIPDVDLHTSK